VTSDNLTPSFFTTHDGLRIAFYELNGGEEPAIILHHGFSANTMHEWCESGIAERLSVMGRRMISIDARAHGKSDHPHESRFYGEDKMARDVMALADQLGLKQYDYLGYSMGGIVGVQVAIGDDRPRRLVVGGIGDGVVKFGGVDRSRVPPEVLAACLRADDPSDFPEMVQKFRAGLVARGGDLLAAAAHCDTLKPRILPLETINIPVLVIAGVDDPIASNPDQLVAALPDARLVLVPGDHGAARLQEGFTAAAIDFLS